MILEWKIKEIRAETFKLKKILRLTIHIVAIIASLLFVQNSVEGTSNQYIKIDLWKKELYVMEKEEIIERFSISIGTELSPTPVGEFKITEKSKAWGGGFGSRWLGLNVPWGVYGIHGTNRPKLIGENVSSGCIRMHNEDVEKLFEMIPIGTKVYIEGPITGTGEGEYHNLSIGSKGNLVELVQGRLKAMGYYHGEIDGIYGSNTDSAIRLFQKENELFINGVVSFREYLLLGLLE